MTSRKLLFISEAFYPYIGGAEISALIVLSKLARYGLDVSVLTHRFPGTKPREFHKGLRISRKRLFPEHSFDFFHRSLFYFKAILVILKFVLKNRPDIVLAQQTISTPAIFVSKIVRIPIIVVIQDYWPVCFYRSLLKPNGQICSSYDASLNEIYMCARDSIEDLFEKPKMLDPILAAPYSILMFIHTLIVKNLLRKADSIVAISHFVKKTLISNGFDTRKIQVIYNPVIMESQIETQSKDLPTLLYVGRLDFEKGVEYLLKAMPQVQKELREVKLIIVGRGRQEKYLRFLAKNLEIEHNVEFLGMVHPDALAHLYKSSHIVVVPSIWAEPFGRVVPEAIMCNRPVIASNVGGISELVSDETGILVPPRNVEALSDAITFSIKNKTLFRSKPKSHNEFSPDTVAISMLNIVERTLRNKRN